jgi:Transposase
VWFITNNALLEGLDSFIQAAKRRARGCRSTRNRIAMIYLTLGKLEVSVTHGSSEKPFGVAHDSLGDALTDAWGAGTLRCLGRERARGAHRLL